MLKVLSKNQKFVYISKVRLILPKTKSINRLNSLSEVMGFKKWWSESPHTFKGILFGIILFFVLSLYFSTLSEEDRQDWENTLGNFIVNGFVYNQSEIVPRKTRPSDFIVSLVILFVGGFIGYLFDKRKKNSQNLQ